MTKLTKESSIKLQNDLTAAGIKACATIEQFETAEGEKTFFRVKAQLADPKTGNRVSKIIEDESDSAAIAKAMKKDLRALSKATRVAIAAERFAEKS